LLVAARRPRSGRWGTSFTVYSWRLVVVWKSVLVASVTVALSASLVTATASAAESASPVRVQTWTPEPSTPQFADGDQLWVFPDSQAYDWFKDDKSRRVWLHVDGVSPDDTTVSAMVVGAKGRSAGRVNLSKDNGTVTVPYKVAMKLTSGMQFRLMRDGAVLDRMTVKVQRGWAPINGDGFDTNGGWSSPTSTIMERCSVVTWAYSTKGEPSSNRSSVTGDVQGALKDLAKYSGLEFRQVKDPKAALLRIEWDKSIGEFGPAGYGGPVYRGGQGTSDGVWGGRVQLNPKSDWAAGQYGSRLPRMLLVQHEIAHAMSLGHVVGDDHSRMAPITTIPGTSLDKGTIRGLKTLYQPQSCR